MTETILAKGWRPEQQSATNLGEEVTTHEGLFQHSQGRLKHWRASSGPLILDTATVRTSRPAKTTFEVVVEYDEPQADRSQIQFDLTDIDRVDIENHLDEASEYPREVRDKLFESTKEFYIEEAEELSPNDIINISYITNYAESQGHDEWTSTLGSIMDRYFDNLGVSRDVVSRAIKDAETISLERAHELYTQETERIENAVNSAYSDRSESERQNLIQAQKRETLWKIAEKVQY